MGFSSFLWTGFINLPWGFVGFVICFKAFANLFSLVVAVGEWLMPGKSSLRVTNLPVYIYIYIWMTGNRPSTLYTKPKKHLFYQETYQEDTSAPPLLVGFALASYLWAVRNHQLVEGVSCWYQHYQSVRTHISWDDFDQKTFVFSFFPFLFRKAKRLSHRWVGKTSARHWEFSNSSLTSSLCEVFGIFGGNLQPGRSQAVASWLAAAGTTGQSLPSYGRLVEVPKAQHLRRLGQAFWETRWLAQPARQL